VDIDAVATARHCHGFALVVGLFALVGKPLVDERLGVGFVATLMVAVIKWQWYNSEDICSRNDSNSSNSW
jgi:hypothetical protein